MNTEWALAELRRFLGLLEYRETPGLYAASYVGSRDDINRQKVAVEKIWDRVLGPRSVSPISSNDPRRVEREWTVRAIETIERDAEIRHNLGDDVPDLSASSIHPWIWEGARSLWQSQHFAEAVEAASKKLNAETQNKVGRRDITEAALFIQCFSDDAPKPGSPRLRLEGDDGGRTALSVRRGVRCFAEGCYAAIRNPLAHDGEELNEVEGLERLAALSLVARWVDFASVDTQTTAPNAGGPI